MFPRQGCPAATIPATFGGCWGFARVPGVLQPGLPGQPHCHQGFPSWGWGWAWGCCLTPLLGFPSWSSWATAWPHCHHVFPGQGCSAIPVLLSLAVPGIPRLLPAPLPGALWPPAPLMLGLRRPLILPAGSRSWGSGPATSISLLDRRVLDLGSSICRNCSLTILLP